MLELLLLFVSSNFSYSKGGKTDWKKLLDPDLETQDVGLYGLHLEEAMCVNPGTLELYILPSMWELRWRTDRLKRMIIAICKMFSEIV